MNKEKKNVLFFFSRCKMNNTMTVMLSSSAGQIGTRFQRKTVWTQQSPKTSIENEQKKNEQKTKNQFCSYTLTLSANVICSILNKIWDTSCSMWGSSKLIRKSSRATRSWERHSKTATRHFARGGGESWMKKFSSNIFFKQTLQQQQHNHTHTYAHTHTHTHTHTHYTNSPRPSWCALPCLPQRLQNSLARPSPRCPLPILDRRLSSFSRHVWLAEQQRKKERKKEIR